MDKASQWRWAVWITTLLATVGAIVYPTEPHAVDHAAERLADDTSQVTPTAANVVAITESGLKLTTAIGQAAPAQSLNPTSAEASDPFAPRAWQAPPLALAAPPAQVAPIIPVINTPAAPSGPPPIPFQYSGRYADSGQQVVYLTLGEQLLVARLGDVLAGSYKVVAIDAQRIEFDYLPTGEKQIISIPAKDN